MQDVYATCIHEAAHAVADLVLGAGVAEVRVDGERGGCTPRGRTSVVACLCGPVAELRLRQPDAVPTAEIMRRNLHDADVQRAIERLGSDDGDLLVACWIEARKLVDAHWESVLLVAEALQRCGRLAGHEVGPLVAMRAA